MVKVILTLLNHPDIIAVMSYQSKELAYLLKYKGFVQFIELTVKRNLKPRCKALIIRQLLPNHT